MMKNAAIGVLACALAACGMGPFADEGGGSSNLPVSGAGPYRVLSDDFDTPAEEPYVLAQPIVSLSDPAVLSRDDGGFDLYYTRQEDDTREIWHVTLSSIHELPGTPRQILVADQPWEEGRIGSVSVVEDGDSLVLFYHAGAEGQMLGRAESRDGGATFVKNESPIVDEAYDGSVTLFDGRWFFVHVDEGEGRVLLRESDDGLVFSEAREIVEARYAIDGTFDQRALRSPALHLQETLSGETHFGLFYTGVSIDNEGNATEGIGYMGSHGGVEWQRFLEGLPILNPGAAGAGAPSPVVGTSSAHLFFHQPRQGRGRIAVGISP
jgi:hypothetical protein